MSRGTADTFEHVVHKAAPREFIAVGIPTFGKVNIFWASRLFGQMRHPMNRDLRYIIIHGNEVGLARNEIVARALEIEAKDPGVRCSHVFFVDDDVMVNKDALLKLLDVKRPIVSGLYYAKTSVMQPLILRGESDGVDKGWTPGDLVDCWAHGMGLTLVEMDVFRKLAAQPGLGTDSLGRPAWFETTRDGVMLAPDGVTRLRNQTEDVKFCRDAAALGYQPCVDTSSQAFAFHWAQDENRAYPLQQWFEYEKHGTITWVPPSGVPVVWGSTA